MKKLELIFVKLICGGIGNAPRLYRYKNKYYAIRGDCDIEGQKKLLDIQYKLNIKCQHKWFLWRKHCCDNEVTASEFLKIIDIKNPYFFPNGSFDLIEEFPVYQKK